MKLHKLVYFIGIYQASGWAYTCTQWMWHHIYFFAGIFTQELVFGCFSARINCTHLRSRMKMLIAGTT